MSTKILLLIFTCLVTVKVSAQEPSQLHVWLPEVPGWTLDDRLEVFDTENLYDRINGAAPLYLENNFREMSSMEYKKGDDYITIQAYRHATPEDAFGMYASERSPDLEFKKIGGEAQGNDSDLFFFAGPFYIKMMGNSKDDLSEVLETIGRGLARKLDSDAGYPGIFSGFPAEGKVPYSEAYITSNYLGHDFLQHVYTADYRTEKGNFQFFALSGTDERPTRDIIKQYLSFAKQEKLDTDSPIINDRYNGPVYLYDNNGTIIGIWSENGIDEGYALEVLRSVTGR